MDKEQEQMPKAINKRLPNGKSEPQNSRICILFTFYEIQKNML